METLKDLVFWLNFIYFLAGVFLAFYIPGNLILRKFKLSFFDSVILSSILGIVLWIWQGFLLGFLNLRFITYIYLAISTLFWIRTSKFSNQFKGFIKLTLSDYILMATIALGTSYLLLTTFLNGVEREGSLYFCCGLPDSLYHLALTNQLINQFPPIEPGASGILVRNYHYLGNLMVADFVRIFQLPLISTTYQYFTVFFSILFGLVAVTFSRILKLDRKYLFLLLIFLYFSGDILYLLMYILGNGFDFSFSFLHHAGWLWVSPSRVYSSVILLGGLSFLALWTHKKSFYLGVVLALIFSILTGIKIYAGIFTLIGLLALSIYYIFKRKHKYLLLPFLTLILSLTIHLYTSNTSGALDFTGLWRFENFIVSPELNLVDWELKRQTFISHQNYPRVVQYVLMYIVVYFIFIFGTLNLAFFQTKKSLSLLPKEFHIFLIPSIFVNLILGSFFIQDIGGANSSQFIITTMIILSIYAALSVHYFTNIFSGSLKLILILIVILLTVPRAFYFAKSQFEFQKVGGGHHVTKDELEALNYLKSNTPISSIILADNINKNNWRNAYSHYISFLSNRQLFLDGEGITADHGVNVKRKLNDQMEIFESSDSVRVNQLLKQDSINYIYLAAKDNLSATNSAQFLEKSFENDKVKILKVR